MNVCNFNCLNYFIYRILFLSITENETNVAEVLVGSEANATDKADSEISQELSVVEKSKSPTSSKKYNAGKKTLSTKQTMKQLKKYQKRKQKPGALVRPISDVKAKKEKVNDFLQASKGKTGTSTSTERNNNKSKKSVQKKRKLAVRSKTDSSHKKKLDEKSNNIGKVPDSNASAVSEGNVEKRSILKRKKSLERENPLVNSPAKSVKQEEAIPTKSKTSKKHRMSMREIIKLRRSLLD